MKRYIPLFFIFLMFPPCPKAARAQREGQNTVPPQVGQAFAEAGLPVLRQRIRAPDFSAPLAVFPGEGKPVRLNSLTGKVVFLNFWATWCGPCRAEMPSMETLYHRFKDQGLEILAVNSREAGRDVTAFLNTYKLSFPAALDKSGRIGSLYGIEAFPTTYIIDREGFIIARIVGSLNWNTPQIFSAFETLIRHQSRP